MPKQESTKPKVQKQEMQLLDQHKKMFKRRTKLDHALHDRAMAKYELSNYKKSAEMLIGLLTCAVIVLIVLLILALVF